MADLFVGNMSFQTSESELRILFEEFGEAVVEIVAGRKGTGKVTLHYSSLDHLDQLLKKLR